MTSYRIWTVCGSREDTNWNNKLFFSVSKHLHWLSPVEKVSLVIGRVSSLHYSTFQSKATALFSSSLRVDFSLSRWKTKWHILRVSSFRHFIHSNQASIKRTQIYRILVVHLEVLHLNNYPCPNTTMNNTFFMLRATCLKTVKGMSYLVKTVVLPYCTVLKLCDLYPSIYLIPCNFNRTFKTI